MASTNLTLHNESDKNIYAVVKWGQIKIAEKTIKKGEKGNLGCEFVWYDLYVHEDRISTPLLMKLPGVYGFSAWAFQGKDNKYEIVAK